MKTTGGTRQKKSIETPSFLFRHLPEAIIFCFAFLLYANSITNNYNLDDELVTKGQKLTSRGISAIPEIFSSPYYTDDAGYSYEYRPVVLSSFAIEHQFFGDNPHVSHFFNLLLYALCCVLLYKVLFSFIPGRAQLLSACITLFFVANPTHTEVVCSIKNRDEILSLLFSLLATYSAFAAVTQNKKWFFLLAPAFFLVALLCKTTVIGFIIFIPLILILFTEAGLLQTLLIAVLLLAPAMWAVDISFWNKLIGASLLLASLGLLFMIVRNKAAFVLQRFNTIKSWFAGQNYFINRGEPASAARGIKDLLIGIKPGPGIFSFKPMALSFSVGALYFLGIFTVFTPIVVVALFAFALLIFRGNQPTWWWASVVFFACLAFAPVKYAWHANLYGELVATILLYQVFFGNRKLFIPATAIYVVFAIASFFAGTIDVVPNRLIGLVALKFIGWPAIIWQAIMLHNIFKHVKFDNLVQSFQVIGIIGAATPLITLLMLSLIFKKGTRYMMGGIVAITLGTMLFFQSQNTPVGIMQVQNTLSNTANKINPQFIDVKQQRPLDYAERPVTYDDSRSVRLGTAFEVMSHYFLKTIWPYPMAFYYGFRFIKPEQITDMVPLAGLLIYLVLAIIAIVFIRKNKLLSLGLFIYLGSLTLFSGYFYPVPGLVAERFMFILSLGFSIVLGAALFTLFRLDSNLALKQWPSASTAPKAIFLLILTLYSALTFSRNFDWKDDLTLFRHDIAYVSESAQANNLLSIHLIHHSFDITDPAQQKTLREEAVIHLKKTVEISPSFFNANYDLGRMYNLLGMPDSALVWFTKAYQIKPAYIETSFDIANIYLARKEYEPAVPYLEYAIKHRPTDYRGYSDLSYIYFQQHDLYKSIETNKQAIQNVSSNASPYVNIANVYLTLNKPDSASIWAHQALAIEPSNQIATQILQQTGNKP